MKNKIKKILLSTLLVTALCVTNMTTEAAEPFKTRIQSGESVQQLKAYSVTSYRCGYENMIPGYQVYLVPEERTAFRYPSKTSIYKFYQNKLCGAEYVIENNTKEAFEKETTFFNKHYGQCEEKIVKAKDGCNKILRKWHLPKSPEVELIFEFHPSETHQYFYIIMNDTTYTKKTK